MWMSKRDVSHMEERIAQLEGQLRYEQQRRVTAEETVNTYEGMLARANEEIANQRAKLHSLGVS